VHAELLALLPERPRPVLIQRWNLQRVGLALLVVLGLILVPLVVGWTVRTDDRMDNSLFTRDVGCTSREPLWLMAQSVPRLPWCPVCS
jgi:hypothetical protein